MRWQFSPPSPIIVQDAQLASARQAAQHASALSAWVFAMAVVLAEEP